MYHTTLNSEQVASSSMDQSKEEIPKALTAFKDINTQTIIQNSNQKTAFIQPKKSRTLYINHYPSILTHTPYPTQNQPIPSLTKNSDPVPIQFIPIIQPKPLQPFIQINRPLTLVSEIACASIYTNTPNPFIQKKPTKKRTPRNPIY